MEHLMASGKGGKGWVRAVPGEPIKIAADQFNSMSDAARAFRDRKSLPGAPVAKSQVAGTTVLIKNNSDEDAPRHGVLKITGVEITPDDNDAALDTPLLAGTEPSSTDDAVVITTEPIESGAIGSAVIAGAIACTINVTSASHDYAAPSTEAAATAVTRLESSAYGHIRILWKDAGTGEKDALVSLASPSAADDGEMAFGKLLDEDFASGTAVAYPTPRARGRVVIPCAIPVSPVVPDTIEEVATSVERHGESPFWTDVTDTGASIDLYIIYSGYGDLIKALLATLTRTTSPRITSGIYWKAWFRSETPVITAGSDSADITAIDQGTKTITVIGDHTTTMGTGETLQISGSTGNDGSYTSTGATLSGGNTEVVVSEAIPDGTADGTLYTEAMLFIDADPLEMKYFYSHIMLHTRYNTITGRLPFS
jgi:hypothetical protein